MKIVQLPLNEFKQLDLTHHGYKKSDIAELIGQELAAWWFEGAPIPLYGRPDLWAALHDINDKIEKADPTVYRTDYGPPPRIYTTNDCFSTNIQSMADGRTYESRSDYYASLKANGMVINDVPSDHEKTKQFESSTDWKSAVAQTMKEKGL